MSKIELSPLPSGFATTAALNARLDQIEDEFNDKVLYRSNPEGEPNAMDNILDMADHNIINLPDATEDHHAVPYGQLIDEVTQEVNEQLSEQMLTVGTGNVVGPLSSTDDQVVLFSGITGKLIKAGQTITQYFDTFLLSLYNLFPVVISNVAAIASTTAVVGRLYELKEYHSGTGYGGGLLVGKVGAITPDNIRTFAGTTGTYFTRQNTEELTAAQCGAFLDGSINIASVINNAITAGVGTISFSEGQYRLDSPIELRDYLTLRGTSGAVIVAGADNFTMFEATTHAYFCRVYNIHADGNGKDGIVFAAVNNMRLQSGWYDCYITDMEDGLYLLGGCFGIAIDNFTAYDGCKNPIVFVENAATAVLRNPNFDNVSGRWAGLGYGVQVQNAGIPNEGVIIDGGYIQGYERGIWDEGRGTRISGTYFEQCTQADIYWAGAIQCSAVGTQHFAGVGAAGFLARSTDGCTVILPNMGSGGRTVLYDVDATNNNFSEYRAGSTTSDNTPLGSTTYISSLTRQTKSLFTPVILGSTTAGSCTYIEAQGKAVLTGEQVHVEIDIEWTGHTGTGALLINGVPGLLSPVSFLPSRIGLVYSEGFASAGNLSVGFTGTAAQLRIISVDPSGVASLLSIPASGTIRINFTYDI